MPEVASVAWQAGSAGTSPSLTVPEGNEPKDGTGLVASSFTVSCWSPEVLPAASSATYVSTWVPSPPTATGPTYGVSGAPSRPARTLGAASVSSTAVTSSVVGAVIQPLSPYVVSSAGAA